MHQEPDGQTPGCSRAGKAVHPEHDCPPPGKPEGFLRLTHEGNRGIPGGARKGPELLHTSSRQQTEGREPADVGRDGRERTPCNPGPDRSTTPASAGPPKESLEARCNPPQCRKLPPAISGSVEAPVESEKRSPAVSLPGKPAPPGSALRRKVQPGLRLRPESREVERTKITRSCGVPVRELGDCRKEGLPPPAGIADPHPRPAGPRITPSRASSRRRIHARSNRRGAVPESPATRPARSRGPAPATVTCWLSRAAPRLRPQQHVRSAGEARLEGFDRRRREDDVADPVSRISRCGEGVSARRDAPREPAIPDNGTRTAGKASDALPGRHAPPVSPPPFSAVTLARVEHPHFRLDAMSAVLPTARRQGPKKSSMMQYPPGESFG